MFSHILAGDWKKFWLISSFSFEEKSSHFGTDLIDLISKLLEPDPEKRLTISEVKKHPYLIS